MSAYLLPTLLVQAAPLTNEVPRQLAAFEAPACPGAVPTLAIQHLAEPGAGITQSSEAATPRLERDQTLALRVQCPLLMASWAPPSAPSAADSTGAKMPIESEPLWNRTYDAGVFWRQARSIPWRFGGAAAAITATGFANWDWGSSSFRFDSEGWFGKDTASLGVDKLGHAYSAYVLTEFFTDGIKDGSPRHRSYTGAILAMGLMTYIEVFDGFSAEHGFSHEDLLADAAGALFSVARRSIPGLRDKLDFRLLYVPSASTWKAFSCLPKPHCDHGGEAVRSPVTDYSGQRYLLALKLSGFERLKSTPLRLVEFHAGYYARGFTKEAENRGDPLRRRLFIGVGLNVGELLFPGRIRGLRGAAKSALEYLQVPYTAIHSN